MKSLTIIALINLTLFLAGVSIYSGTPGLQFILSIPIGIVAISLSIFLIFRTRKNKPLVFKAITLLLLSILTLSPIIADQYIHNGKDIKTIGLTAYSVASVYCVIIILGHLIKNQKNA